MSFYYVCIATWHVYCLLLDFIMKLFAIAGDSYIIVSYM
jgi:hypothetical protein